MIYISSDCGKLPFWVRFILYLVILSQDYTMAMAIAVDSILWLHGTSCSIVTILTVSTGPSNNYTNGVKSSSSWNAIWILCSIHQFHSSLVGMVVLSRVYVTSHGSESSEFSGNFCENVFLPCMLWV